MHCMQDRSWTGLGLGLTELGNLSSLLRIYTDLTTGSVRSFKPTSNHSELVTQIATKASRREFR